MDSDAKQSADTSLELQTWLSENWGKLLAGLLAIIVVVGGIAGFGYYKKTQEANASDALSNLKAPTATPGGPAPQIPAADFIKVANEHAGTVAASRALLMAGASFFEAGKFKDAQTQFEKFLAQSSDSPLATQGRIGVAASLEAQGNLAEAATKYQDLITRQPNDFVIPQAKSALARIYETQGKYAEALKLYEELAGGMNMNNDSWTMEASIQKEELLTKHPELKKTNAPVVSPIAPSVAPKPSVVLTNQVSTNK